MDTILVKDLLNNLLANEFDMSLKTETKVYVDSKTVYNLMYFYSSFFYIFTENSTITDFENTWQTFNTLNAKNLFTLLDAYDAEYSKIFNYDMTEEYSKGIARDSETSKTTPSGNIITEQTQFANGFDSVNDGVQTDKAISKTSYENANTETTNTKNNSLSISFPDGKTGNNFNETEKNVARRFGNIGVQTTADIIEKEIDLRRKSIIKDYIERFAFENFYGGLA